MIDVRPHGRRRRLAVAASARFPDLRPDWPLLRQALAERGVEATAEVWNDPAVPWDGFDLVLANGAWDNIHQPDHFLAWADQVAGRTTLVNPPAVLRWNMDKRYLADLAGAGVPTVPTTWHSPTDRPDAGGLHVDFPPGDVVVKPSVSGGGFQTARYTAAEHEPARRHIGRLLEQGRTVMVQPYVDTVDRQGEVGLILLGGQFSHAIGKGPLLRPGAGTQEDLWAQQQITLVDPTEGQLQAARSALAAAEHRTVPTTYARVDLVTLADGRPAVLELELLDPALFFEFEPAGAVRFAEVLVRTLGQAAASG